MALSRQIVFRTNKRLVALVLSQEQLGDVEMTNMVMDEQGICQSMIKQPCRGEGN